MNNLFNFFLFGKVLLKKMEVNEKYVVAIIKKKKKKLKNKK